MRRLSIWCRVYLGLAAFSVAGTAYSLGSHTSPGLIAPIAGAFTLLCGVVTVFEPIFSTMGWKKGWLCFGAVFLIGAAAEVVGIYTGFPFGQYEYGSTWWPTIVLPGGLYYPLLVPFAWTMVVGGAYVWRLWPILLGAITATLVDLFSERAMVSYLRFWYWKDPMQLAGAPYSNYLGWLGVSALALGALWVLGARPTKRPEPVIVLCAHVIMILLMYQTGRT